MKNIKFDVDKIYNCVVRGVDYVVKNETHLNNINVFPINDNDTGSNLVYTLNSIKNETVKVNRVDELFDQIYNITLFSARGNSGNIFNEYFYGFKNATKNKEKLDINSLVLCFKKAGRYAYNAVETPKKGTMLSLMSSFYKGLEGIDEKGWKEKFKKTLNHLDKLLNSTKKYMYKYKKVLVEDAGAKAFYLFMYGFIQNLISEEKSYIAQYNDDVLKYEHLDEDINFRYCTEALVEKDKALDIEKLKEKLKLFGDSLVLRENEKFLKVHIHTDDAKRFMEELLDYGFIIKQKVDDMSIQSLKKSEDICVVTDSVADIDEALIEKYNIYQLPTNLIIGKHNFLDKLTIDYDIYKKLVIHSKLKLSSSAISMKQLEDFLNPLMNKYKKIIIISVSSKMSSNYDRFLKYQKENKDKLIVIDSKLNSVAQGLIALEIKEDMSVKDIERLIDKTKIFVSVEDIDPMIKSGRVPTIIGKIFKRLKILPIVSIEKGKGSLRGIYFNKEKNLEGLIKNVTKNRIKKYAIVHCNNLNKAKKVAEKLYEKTKIKTEYITQSSMIVQSSAGQNAIGVGVIYE